MWEGLGRTWVPVSWDVQGDAHVLVVADAEGTGHVLFAHVRGEYLEVSLPGSTRTHKLVPLENTPTEDV
jgi:hypothetical protein